MQLIYTKNIPYKYMELNKTNSKAYIMYTIIGFIYGIILWFQSIILIAIGNKQFANNLIGLNLTIGRNQLKGLILSFVISIIYTIKDFYDYSNG